MNKPPRLVAGLVVLLIALPTFAAEPTSWSQIRGPFRSGHATEPVEPWPEGGPERLWERPVGSGFSGIVVAGSTLFTGYEEEGVEYGAAIDVASGEERWRVELGETFVDEFGDGPRATPAVADGRVVFLGSHGRLVAADASTGMAGWTLEIKEAFGSPLPRRGFSSSPLLADGAAIVAAGGGEGEAVVAIDVGTGEVRWKALDGGPSYSSPILVELEGEPQIVAIGGGAVNGLGLDGSVRWTHAWTKPTIAMPVFVPPDRVFVSTVDDEGSLVLAVDGAPNGSATEVVWQGRVLKNHFSSSVFNDGHVIGFDNATLKCIDAGSGEQGWAKRGFGKGTVIVAGGSPLVLSDRGRLVLLDRGCDTYRERASFRAIDGKSWTEPTVAGGKLFLRNLERMVAYRIEG